MNLYIVRTNYLNCGIYGVYSTLRRAQLALEDFLKEDDNIVTMEKTDPYTWLFTTKIGEQFSVEIIHDILDYEFKARIIEE